ncbi:Uncharacterised protein [Klebsiella pneumoniae]|nr:Uncharacterised protein [Klebsiella pneumoniae]
MYIEPFYTIVKIMAHLYRLEEGFYQALMMHSYKFLIRRFQVHGNNVGVMLLLKAIHMIWLCNTL